jgi:hypothetical protein
MIALVKKWKDRVDFVFIYIQEAHASDEWPIQQLEIEIHQHQTIEERMIAAERFIKDFNVPHDIPFLVDGMSNDFNNKYASWPFRFWVLKKDRFLRPRVQFKAMPRLAAYFLEDLDESLIWLTA